MESKKYQLTKSVEAVPMLRGDYNDLRGWITPEGESAFDEGYYMLYPDNYKTWMAKPVFDNCFKEEIIGGEQKNDTEFTLAGA